VVGGQVPKPAGTRPRAPVDRALRIADELETGMIDVDTGLVSDPLSPFGGLGRAGGAEGIDE
jgi:succinate-semialdehyde dehydrogenase/glutarate-semialdehyde dehydrogenase